MKANEMHVATVLTLVSAGMAWLFVVAYHVLSTRAARREPDRAAPWWRSAGGLSIMNLAAEVAVLTTLPTLARLLGVRTATSDWFAWTYLAIYAGLPVALVWLVGLLLRSHRVWPFRGATGQDG